MKKYKVTYIKNRPSMVFNCGSTQDPRTAAIGKTTYNRDTGTYFNESPFIKAIRTPNTIIILDEISRAHPEFWNLCIPALDELQRSIRLDESEEGELVKVAEGVCFIATANIGSEYTATRVMDRALLGRFTVKVEMDFLTKEDEMSLVKDEFPDIDDETVDIIVDIAQLIRVMARTGKVHAGVPTRSVLEMAGLYCDGFSLLEIVEMVLYNDYPDDGEVDSERTLITQIVQKFIPAAGVPKNLNTKNPLT